MPKPENGIIMPIAIIAKVVIITEPVFEKLYKEVASGNEAQRSIDTNSKPDYREGLEKELKELRESEMWRTGAVVRKLRPENN